MLFHVMITDEVPVTILQAYFSLPRHIRKGRLIDRLLHQFSVKRLVASNFAKESRKLKRKIMFEHNYSFYHHRSCIAVT